MLVVFRYLILLILNIRLGWKLLRDRRVPWVLKIIPVISLAYLLFPLDLLRDFIPVMGLADDLILLVVGFLLLKNLAPRHVVEEHSQIFPRAAGAKESDQIITDAKYRIIDDEK